MKRKQKHDWEDLLRLHSTSNQNFQKRKKILVVLFLKPLWWIAAVRMSDNSMRTEQLQHQLEIGQQKNSRKK